MMTGRATEGRSGTERILRKTSVLGLGEREESFSACTLLGGRGENRQGGEVDHHYVKSSHFGIDRCMPELNC